jgi:nucleoside-diphosphate-sugar epimerase
VLNSVANSPSIKTLVHTSSIAAIQNRGSHKIFDESSWNTWATLETDPYGFAKTEAEQLVWEWAKQNRSGVKIRIMNPTVVLGPVQTKAHTKSSTVFFREAVYGNSVEPFWATTVDVRDVALAHVRALELDQDAPHRFLLANDSAAICMSQIGGIAQSELPEFKLQTPPKYSPMVVWLLVLLSLIPVIGKFFLTDLQRSALTYREKVSNKKSKTMLKMKYRPLSETVKDGVQSVIDGGYVKPKRR